MFNQSLLCHFFASPSRIVKHHRRTCHAKFSRFSVVQLIQILIKNSKYGSRHWHTYTSILQWEHRVWQREVGTSLTLSISSMGLLILNSLLVLPGAASRNIARNQKQYHLYSVLFALASGLTGLSISYSFGCSAGAAISLVLTLFFAVTYVFRGRNA